MDFDLKWKLRVVENFLKEEGLEEEKIWLFHQLLKKNKYSSMKSKIFALSKNEDFKTLLNQKKISNKYVSIFFGKLKNKYNKKINISFVTKKN